MNEGRNSLLVERVQPFQAYRLGSYPTDNIISVIIITSDHTIYVKKTSYLCYNIYFTIFKTRKKIIFRHKSLSYMDSSTTGLIDRRAQTLIGQHLPPISFAL